jgi:hypothetical protein
MHQSLIKKLKFLIREVRDEARLNEDIKKVREEVNITTKNDLLLPQSFIYIQIIRTVFYLYPNYKDDFNL